MVEYRYYSSLGGFKNGRFRYEDYWGRKADNNMHRTSRGEPSSGEYFHVQIRLENLQSIKIVPNFIEKFDEYCRFSGWTSIDGHYISVSGQYDNDFANSYIESIGDY